MTIVDDTPARIEDRLVPVCAQPIFVVGSPRSATTALALALAEHPALWTSGESYFLHDLFGDRRVAVAYQRAVGNPSAGWLRHQHVEETELLRALGLGVNALFTSRSGGRTWIDQTPHHVYMLDTLAEMFPGARFLHIVREGRAVVRSMLHFLDRLTPEERAAFDVAHVPPWAVDLEAACSSWASSVRAGLAFASAHPGRCTNVRQEDLAAVPGPTLAAVLDFLGLAADDAPRRFAEEQRVNSSFVNGDGAARDEWTEEHHALFTAVAGETYAEYRRTFDA